MNFRILMLVALACLPLPMTGSAQTTAFNYSGQLNYQGAPANGFFDFIFTLIPANPPPDPEINGVPTWPNPIVLSKVPVTNGLFTVTLDFGALPFDGAGLFIGIQVRTHAQVDPMQEPPDPGPPYTELSPHQPIRSTPYAIRALNAGTAYTVTGPVPDASIPSTVARLGAASQTLAGQTRLPNPGNTVAGSFRGDGAGLRHVQFGSLDFGGVLSLDASPFLSLNSSFIPGAFFQVADFNRDGRPDIASLVDNATRILTNDNAGHFVAALSLPVSNPFAVVDLNADGFMDLVAGSRCFTNIGGLAFTPGEIGGGFDGDSVFGHLNADGDLDAVKGTGGAWLNYRNGMFLDIVVVEGVTNEIYSPPGFPAGCATPIPGCGRGALVDVNGDGLLDWLVRRCNSNAINIVTNRNAGFGCPWPLSALGVQMVPMPAGFYDFRAADFNGDGWVDILAAHRISTTSNATLSLYLNLGASGFLPSWTSVPLTNLATFEIADLNRDGRADVVALQATPLDAAPEAPRLTGTRSFYSDGRGGFATAAFAPLDALGLPNGRFALADANGDGAPDVLIGNWGIAYGVPPSLVLQGPLSLAATSGPPLNVSSTARVDRLNSDLLDGLDSSAFVSKSGDSMSGPLAAPSFAGNGSALTGLDAGNLTSGTLADGHLSANVNLLNASQTVSGTKTFAPSSGAPFVVGNSNRVTHLNADLLDGLDSSALVLKTGDVLTGPLAASAFSGNGSALTGLNAANVASGTLADARLSANVMLLDASQAVTGFKSFAPLAGLPPFAVGNTMRVANLNADLLDGLEGSAFLLKAGGTLTGPLTATAFSGDGSGLTGLDAASIATGTLPLTRGGTGAGNAATARANLNAATRGANSDISSLNGLTTPLSVAQGGTSAGDPTNALRNLGGAALAGLNVYSGTNHLTNTANVLAGNGSAITALSPSALSGPVSPSRGGLGFDSSTVPMGSLLQATGAGTWGALPAGGEGLVLKISSGVPAWGVGYTAGAGLTLSGTAFSVNYAGSGTANTAARSDHTHDASALVSGILPDARLGGTYSSALMLNNAANSMSGNGAGLTSLNAASLSSGTVPDGRIASTVARLNVSQTFTASTSLGTGAQLLGDAGSAAAPGLSFSGDPDTGWFRPAANLVALATAGAERLRVDASGNVGVGTPTPTAQLDVNGSVKATSFTGSGAGLTGLNPANLSAGAVPAAVTFPNAANAFTGSFVGDGSGLTGLDAARITIGILPDLRLSDNIARNQVPQTFTANKTFAPGVRLLVDSGGASTPGLTFSGDPGTGLYQPSSSQLALSTGGQERMRLDAFGKVGIGLTAPEVALDVHTPINVNASMRLSSGGSWGLVFNQSPSSLFTITNGGLGRLAIEPGGNVGLGTNDPSQKLHVVGNILATGTITPNSDRNAKTGFTTVDLAAVLEKVTQLPIQEWRFKSEPEAVKHLGPMAQDFRAAFGLGEISTAIATVDADGVALAAIQALNQKLEQRLKAKEVEIEALQRSVEELRRLVTQSAGNR